MIVNSLKALFENCCFINIGSIVQPLLDAMRVELPHGGKILDVDVATIPKFL